MSTQKTLRIGVLYEQTQMSDLVGIDILGNCSTRVMDMVSEVIPVTAALKPFAIPMEFLYISSKMENAWTTPEMFVRPNYTYKTAPRDLDIILLGGPNPATVHPDSLTFLQEAAEQTKVIMTTCTGGMWLARTGLLDGKKATTNRIMLTAAKQMMPNVQWQDKRWVVDDGVFDGAQFWTAGGAGCGIDMVIEYALQTFNKELVAVTCQGLEFSIEGRSEMYKGDMPVLGKAE